MTTDTLNHNMISHEFENMENSLFRHGISGKCIYPKPIQLASRSSFFDTFDEIKNFHKKQHEDNYNEIEKEQNLDIVKKKSSINKVNNLTIYKTKVKKIKVEQTKVEQTKVEQTKVEQTKVEQTKVEKLLKISPDSKCWKNVVDYKKVDYKKVDYKKVKEPIVLNIDVKSYENKSRKLYKGVKSRMCSSVNSGVVCNHGDKCRFAHTMEELCPNTCFSGDNCKSFQTCLFLHPCETKKEFCQRVGINLVSNRKNVINKIENAKIENAKIENAKIENAKIDISKSRMCSSVKTGNSCRYGEKCRFAHNLEELKPSTCFFGNDCRLLYDSKSCLFLHPCETKNEYCERIGIL